MNVLLDTCALIALSNGPLPERSAECFGQANLAYASSASVWEAANKFKAGKLSLPSSPLAWFGELRSLYRLTEIPMDAALVCAAADLPLIHRDPFDRVLVATALRERLAILTSDTTIPKYPGIIAHW